jgi:hypothetical protein
MRTSVEEPRKTARICGTSLESQSVEEVELLQWPPSLWYFSIPHAHWSVSVCFQMRFPAIAASNAPVEVVIVLGARNFEADEADVLF